jgi:16S rRNA (cytidine1402-2'-O)-methyltransferase
MGRLGTLYLVPSSLGAGDAASVLAKSTLARLSTLATFIVENPKTARQFLKEAGYPRAVQEVEFHTLNEHTGEAQLAEMLSPLLEGRDCGLISEAGCPAVADPGAALVALAHAHGVRVVPLVGPSAIVLALMASGLNGQRFAFHGYLPVDKQERRRKLTELERDALKEDRTQIFIEAPYRNSSLLQAILETCQDDTLLCLATDLTSPDESVHTQAIAAWKKKPPDLNRRPTVFLLYRTLQKR